MPLTPTQGTIVAAIRSQTTEQAHPPTLREIAHRADLASPSTVSRRVSRLTELDYVTWQHEVARSIRLTERATPGAPTDPADLIRTVENAEQRARQAERALSTARAEADHSRQRSARWKAETTAVRELHRAVPDHPRALLEADDPDREYIECGRDADADANRHHWDLESGSWRCTTRGARSPMVCGHCRDSRGRPVPAPCPTFQAMDRAKAKAHPV